MKNNKIIVGSMTHAIKLKKILSRQGIASKQVKEIREEGCLHGVEIAAADLFSAIAILKESGIEYSVE